jgi:hypothetical protein
MTGVHAFWSQPTLTGTQGHHLKGEKKFKMFDFELLHFVLSALFYKKYNGPIHLYTDNIFATYLNENKLLNVWDFVDVGKYNEFTSLNVNPKSNWTGFKTWLLSQIPSPFLLIDHDNIVYTKIPTELFDISVRFAHLESINPYYYPNRQDMECGNFKFNDEWNWDLDVANTCLLYFNNEKFKNEYSNKAMEFEVNNSPTNKHLAEVQYLFADQRLLVMMLEQANIDYGTFSNRKFTPDGDNPDWTNVGSDKLIDKVGFDHTWGYKHHLKENKIARKIYMQRHIKMIEDSFDDFYDLLLPLFKKYI